MRGRQDVRMRGRRDRMPVYTPGPPPVPLVPGTHWLAAAPETQHKCTLG